VKKKLRAAGPWVGLLLLLLLPIYVISAVFAIRSGLFDLRDRTISDSEIQAVWTLVASGIATAVTLIGLLLTRSHNQRMLERTAMDTVVKGLELIVGHEGKYAPKARVAGALAALVHLGHPIIAMRTLNAAWADEAVDLDTATWLIGEVMKTGSDESKNEASILLATYASRLAYDEPQRGMVSWPDTLWDQWPLNLPEEARTHNLEAILETLVSRDLEWWGRTHGWAVILLDEARLHDPDPWISDKATCALTFLIRTFGDPPSGYLRFKHGLKDLEEMFSQIADFRITDLDSTWASGLLPRLASWAGQVVPDSSVLVQPDNSVLTAEDGRRRRPPAGRP
jgi:hypothetical protein